MNGNSFVLVTSSLKECRSTEKENLFLGHWCLEFDEIKQFPNSVVMKYHWAEFEKLKSDYQLLDKIYEKNLIIISEELNSIHGVQNSIRYWRILIGPWLGYFIQGMFDKWQNLNRAFNDYNIEKTIVIDFCEEKMIPNDMESFTRLISSNEWNHYCYSQIIKYLSSEFSFNLEVLKPVAHEVGSKSNLFSSLFPYLVLKLKKVLNFIASKNKVLIASTYLGFWKELKLNLKLRQFPFFYHLIKLKRSKPDLILRNQLIIDETNLNRFDEFIIKQIFKQIPTCFLEGYNKLRLEARSNFFPSNPKVIYTSNITTYDVVSMEYIASHVEADARLIHGQHGGYGVPKFMFLEDHEIKISDKFLSWGWTKNISNVFPIGMQIPVNKYQRDYPKGNHLLVIRGLWPKYLFRIDSGSGLNLNDTIDNCINFAGKLNQTIRDNNLLIRLYHSDYGFNEKARWEQAISNVNFSKDNSNIYQLVRDSRLVVYTYNVSTGYLEFINANIPTILFWDMKCSPVSDDAVEIFEELKNVGIFHNDSESVANYINLIWDNIDEWWNSENVVKARMNLCLKFANVHPNIEDNIANLLRENL